MTSPREPFTCLYRGIWNDEKFWLRSELGQRVYLYLLSTPLGNGLGCFRAGMAAMAEDLRMTPARFDEGFKEGFDERLGEPLFLYDENSRVIFIPKYLERNPPSNPNGIRSLSKAFILIPDCKLKHDCYLTVKAFVEGKKNPSKNGGETFVEAFSRTFVEPSPNHTGNLKQTMLATFAEPPGIKTLSLSYSLSSSSQKEEDQDSTEPGFADSAQVTLPLVPMTPRQVEAIEALRDISFKVSGWSKPEDTVREILGEEAAQSLARDLGGDAYPAVAIRQTIAQAAAWCRANQSKAKTPRGMARFLNAWFEREQNRGGARPAPTATAAKEPTAGEMEMRRIQEAHDKRHGKRTTLPVLPREEEEIEMSRMQAEWDRVHGTKPAAK